MRSLTSNVKDESFRSWFQELLPNFEECNEINRLRSEESQIYLSNDASSIPLLRIQDPSMYSQYHSGFAYVQNNADSATT